LSVGSIYEAPTRGKGTGRDASGSWVIATSGCQAPLWVANWRVYEVSHSHRGFALHAITIRVDSRASETRFVGSSEGNVAIVGLDE
jgi:hypothetical protein